MPALLSAGPAAVNPYRDPAWRGRVLWTLAALALLGPALVAVDFRLWLFFEPDNLKVTLNFLSSFLPPATAPDFLLMVLRETWRTVAIATAALVLALVLAVPLTLLSTAAVSISSLSGRMHSAAWALRQAVRGLLVLLRSVPELVWALVFVRVLGLGRQPVCWPSPSPTPACWARCTARFWKAAGCSPRRACCATAAAGCRRSSTRCYPATRVS
jgi:phosphonate transport system permease protein